MEAIFQPPREYGSAEWRAFMIGRNDLRPITRFLRRAIYWNAVRHGEQIRLSQLVPPDKHPRVSREQQLADMREAYGS